MGAYKNRLAHLDEMQNDANPPTTGEINRIRTALKAAALDDSPDGVATLLRLLTRLANCGLDAGARPLLPSIQSRS